MPRQGLEGLGVERRGALGPGRNGPFVQGFLFVGHHHVWVEGELCAQAIADRAGPERIVEREQPGLDLAYGEA